MVASSINNHHPMVFDLQDDHDKDAFYDPSSKRWPKPEVLALIKLRTGLERRFHEPGSKAVLWEEISRAMAMQGYNRTAKRCKEKWENINKYFKKAKESKKLRPENAKTCPYFHELDALYKRGVLRSPGEGNAKPVPQLLLSHKVELEEERALQIAGGHGGELEDSGQTQQGDSSDMLAGMRSAGENETGGASSNEIAVHLFISPESTRGTSTEASNYNDDNQNAMPISSSAPHQLIPTIAPPELMDVNQAQAQAPLPTDSQPPQQPATL